MPASISFGDSTAQGSAPRPPALATSIATSTPVELAMGAWAIGRSMPNRSRRLVSGQLMCAATPLAAASAEQAQTERVELDEAFGVLLVVSAFVVLEGDDLAGIERLVARPPDDDDIALVEFEYDLAFDMLLALVDKRLQHLAFRREPESVIDQLRVARHLRDAGRHHPLCRATSCRHS